MRRERSARRFVEVFSCSRARGGARQARGSTGPEQLAVLDRAAGTTVDPRENARSVDTGHERDRVRIERQRPLRAPLGAVLEPAGDPAGATEGVAPLGVFGAALPRGHAAPPTRPRFNRVLDVPFLVAFDLVRPVSVERPHEASAGANRTSRSTPRSPVAIAERPPTHASCATPRSGASGPTARPSAAARAGASPRRTRPR
jgi:hypothetical protein